MPFKFRLEHVLTIRRNEEEAAKRAFSQVAARVALREESIVRIGKEQEEMGRRLQGAHSNMDEMRNTLRYMDVLQDKLVVLQDDLLREKNILAEKKRLLSEATKQKKVIENLKEKAFEKWNAEEQQRELLFQDEINTIRYAKEIRDNE